MLQGIQFSQLHNSIPNCFLFFLGPTNVALFLLTKGVENNYFDLMFHSKTTLLFSSPRDVTPQWKTFQEALSNYCKPESLKTPTQNFFFRVLSENWSQSYKLYIIRLTVQLFMRDRTKNILLFNRMTLLCVEEALAIKKYNAKNTVFLYINIYTYACIQTYLYMHI